MSFFNFRPLFYVIGLVCAIGAVPLGALAWHDPDAAAERSEKDIVAFSETGVVRIVQEVSGTIRYRPFRFDLKSFSFEDATGREETQEFDENMRGTGFVVGSDGLILTNAHVVSPEIFRAVYASGILAINLIQESARLSEDEAERAIERFESLTPEEEVKLTRELLEYVTLEDVTSTVTVLDPSAPPSSSLDELLESGMRADVVALNDDFFFTDKDVAAITIPKSGLPALVLAEEAGLSKSDKIFTFGFPASGDVTDLSVFESTFTGGTVSAIKDSDRGEFSLIQTSAKVSKGSSGSPLLGDDGTVRGIVTSQTADQTLGDSFAFGIPVEVLRDFVKENGLTISPGTYFEELSAGIGLLRQRHCEDAVEAFERIKENTNSAFLLEENIDPYIDECEQMIASGNSIDTVWDEYLVWLAGFSVTTWMFVVGGFSAAIIAAVVIVFLVKRMRRGEKEMHSLEDMLVRNRVRTATAQKAGNVSAQNQGAGGDQPQRGQRQTETRGEMQDQKPDENTAKDFGGQDITLDVINYIKRSRIQGVGDAQIMDQLTKAGWNHDLVNRALEKA